MGRNKTRAYRKMEPPHNLIVKQLVIQVLKVHQNKPDFTRHHGERWWDCLLHKEVAAGELLLATKC
jgi:hypothetical protein